MINLLNPDGTYQRERRQVRRARPASWCASGWSRTSKQLGTARARRRRIWSALNHSDRSKTPIEPYLSDQWFVRMGDDPDGSPGFAQQAMDAVTVGPGQDSPRALRQELPRLAGREARLVHQPPALVGAPDPDLALRDVLRGRPRVARSRGRDRRRLAAGESGGWLICAETDLRRDELGPGHTLGPGSRRPRHLVQLGALAPLDPGLARADARARRSTIRPACSRRPATSSRSGWPGW